MTEAERAPPSQLLWCKSPIQAYVATLFVRMISCRGESMWKVGSFTTPSPSQRLTRVGTGREAQYTQWQHVYKDNCTCMNSNCCSPPTHLCMQLGLGGIGVSLHDISCRNISRYYYLSRLLKMTAILE